MGPGPAQCKQRGEMRNENGRIMLLLYLPTLSGGGAGGGESKQAGRRGQRRPMGIYCPVVPSPTRRRGLSCFKTMLQGLPWRRSGEDSVLPMQEAQA